MTGPDRPAVRPGGVRLVIGPANFAGQAWQWAKAVERARPDVSTTVVAVRNEVLDFPADYAVPDDLYRWARWSASSNGGSSARSRTCSSTAYVR